MQRFRHLFQKTKCPVIGMIHVGALPGTPKYQNSIEKITEKACREAETYLNNGIDSLLIENMHDVPYIQAEKFGPEVVATMTRIATEIRRITSKDFPCGIQILAAGNREALAVALAADLHFIRAEGFVFGHVADEGYIDANAGGILRYRKHLGAEGVLVFADIKKKHSAHAITSDVNLVETAKAAEFFLADGLILTGNATGNPANPNNLVEIKNDSSLPVLIGSGVSFENLEKFSTADGLIIGSYFKKDGKWSNELDEERIREFMKKKCDMF